MVNGCCGIWFFDVGWYVVLVVFFDLYGDGKGVIFKFDVGFGV